MLLPRHGQQPASRVAPEFPLAGFSGPFTGHPVPVSTVPGKTVQLLAKVHECIPRGRMIPGILVQPPAHIIHEGMVPVRASLSGHTVQVKMEIESHLPFRKVYERFYPWDRRLEGP